LELDFELDLLLELLLLDLCEEEGFLLLDDLLLCLLLDFVDIIIPLFILRAIH
jgi:hypothetical protein